MIEEPAAVEDHPLDALFDRSLGDRRADRFRALDVAALDVLGIGRLVVRIRKRDGCLESARQRIAATVDGGDISFVDLLLEQGAGLGVVARCRKTSSNGRVVVFSAYASPGVRNRCV